MSIDEAIREWKVKRRRMGYVSATNWFCKRVKGFYPKRLNRYTANGYVFQHVVATDGVIIIDLAPYSDKPNN